MLVKPLFERADLIDGPFCLVDAGYQSLRARHIAKIPADMLAGRAYAGELAVKPVVVFEVVEQACAQLAEDGRGKVGSRSKKMRDFAENPGAALCGPADHDCIGARIL